MTTSVIIRPHPRGIEGVEEGMREIADRMDRSRYHPRVIEWTRQALQQAGALEPRGRPDPTRIVWALFNAIKKRVGFVRDPVDTEMITTATELLCLDPKGYCIPAGDCDDQVVLLGATALSAGVPVRLQNRFYKGQGQAHIVLLYDADPRLRGQWTCIDPSLDSGYCSAAPFEKELVMDVHVGNADGGTFIGIGDPPPAELGAAESDVWTARVQNAYDAITRSTASLRAKRQALVNVRADLGYPDADPPDAGGDVSRSPLARYTDTFKWTSEAQRDEAKLISAADYAASILADGLGGRRKMAFLEDGPDVAIGGLPNDPYWIQMKKNASGNLVASYVDPKTGDFTGQIGGFWLAAGGAAGIIGGLALTLAAAWNLDKILDFVAQRHHDNMLLEMAEFQQKMLAAGHTPEQVAALTHANADLAKSSQLETKSGISVPMLILAVLAAAAGGFVLSRYGGPAISHYDTRAKRAVENRYAAGEARRRRRAHDPAFVSRKIRQLRREGYGQTQAAAIAYRMDRQRAGVAAPHVFRSAAA